MASRRVEQNRAEFKRYKEDVEREGKQFHPYAMFHDTVMSLVVVCVIIGLACVWYFTSGEDPEDVGWLGPRYTEPADPGTTSFVPRPDWFYYFLFYLLRILKWPETVVIGTVGIPTIAIILLLALPFMDVRRERRILRRPVALVAAILTVISMGVLTYKGATAEEPSGTEADALAQQWAEQQGFTDNQEAIAGAMLFAESGCLNCHVYLDSGASNLGGPELSEIGNTSRDAQAFAQYVADPSQFGNNVMPKFGMEAGGSLTDEQLNQIGAFLEASKGG
jgi:cytochrome c2